MTDLGTAPTETLLLSSMAAAKMLGISKRSLEREIARGKFPRPLKIGSSSRFTYNDVMQYLQQLQAARGGVAS